MVSPQEQALPGFGIRQLDLAARLPRREKQETLLMALLQARNLLERLSIQLLCLYVLARARARRRRVA